MRPGGARHVPGRRTLTATVAQCAILLGATPDAALPWGGRPFLAWLIRDLLRFGVTDVLLLGGGPPAEAAVPAIQAALPRPIRITAPAAPAGIGTGGALHHARGLLGERFLVCGGSAVLDFNLARLLADAAADPGPRIVLRHAADAGMSLLDRSILPLLRPVCSLEADILPILAASGVLRTTVAPGFPAKAGLPGTPTRPALMLDRDGTINRDHGWVGTRDRWEWMPGAVEAVRAATEAGWHVFVVTNQSGIARGHYDEAALDRLHGWMTDELRRAGGTVDDIRFCPFHAEAGIGRYRRASGWRKPAPGMILDLIAKWGLDPARCVLVGDQPSDMEAAAAAGVRGQPFDGGNLLATVAPLLG